ncbi:MAG: serine hydrolase [Pseudomonadota bacterium]
MLLLGGLAGGITESAMGVELEAVTVEERMRQVETHLLPDVRIQGRTEPMALADRMAHYRVPGVSIAVIDQGRIAWAKGYGVTDAQSRSPVDERTLFQAASISKPVTSAAVLRLVDGGVLDLDRDVHEALRSWQVPTDPMTERHPVTLRGLLSHRAGLTVHGFAGYPVGSALPNLVQILAGEPPANNPAVVVEQMPGRAFQYSGGGYTIIQQLLVDVLDQPFAALMSTVLLEPLGMDRSTFALHLSESMAGSATKAHGSDGEPLAGGWHVYPESAAAGLWTTPSDIARLVIALQGGLGESGEPILSRGAVREMLHVQGDGPTGLGVFIEGDGDATRFGHGGANEGFRSEMVGYAEGGWGAVVMTNGANGGALISEILNGIAATYGWPGYLAEQRVVAEVDAATLETHRGTYHFAPLPIAPLAIRLVDRRLMAQWDGGQALELLPESDTAFFLAGAPIEVRFVQGEDGATTHLILRMEDGTEVAAERRSRATPR